MGHTGAFCRAAGGAGDGHVPGRHFWLGNFFPSRLRALWLPARGISSRVLLARRTPALESVQRLRAAVPGAMEHHDLVPVVVVLPASAAVVVARDLLPRPFFSRRPGNVFSGP